MAKFTFLTTKNCIMICKLFTENANVPLKTMQANLEMTKKVQ